MAFGSSDFEHYERIRQIEEAYRMRSGRVCFPTNSGYNTHLAESYGLGSPNIVNITVPTINKVLLLIKK